ncbi:unnamed protein product [Effrenium voratum]|nr:unnamed protein product [Effrenium voratum]
MAESGGGLAEKVGDAKTAEELKLCKIGGCSKSTPMLSREEVIARMPALPNWSLSGDGAVLTRSFVAKDWAAAMRFFNEASVIAEAEHHHPDLHLTNWRNVQVDIGTHAIGGLSLGDFVLAAKMDTIEVEYSPKWLREKAAKEPPKPEGS